jgi:SAM-dependent methyltransferase
LYANTLICKKCNTIYQRSGNKILFEGDVLNNDINNWEKANKDFNPFILNNNGKFKHPNIINGPKMANLKKLLVSKLINPLCINLGSGQDNFEGYVNIDYGNYEHVNIVANIKKTPFIDNCTDLIISNSVLEHIDNPSEVVNEIFRILKPNGKAYICVPQVCVRHHTIDYYRWTIPGMTKLFSRFNILETGFTRSPAYSIFSIIEILQFNNLFNLFQKTKIKISKLLLNFLFKYEYNNNEFNIASSNTIYIIIEKPLIQ